jgi:hypothetical protein
MTDQRTLKKIIKEQREAITILENAVRLADEFKEKMRENWKVEVAKLEAKIEVANNTLKQARDFIEEIGDDKLSTKDVLSFISTLEEALLIPRNREPNTTEQYADACHQIEKQQKEDVMISVNNPIGKESKQA